MFSQTRYYSLVGYYFLNFRKLKIFFYLNYFTNKKMTNLVTNNFSTLINIRFIEVLHVNNFIPFKFMFKLF